MAMFGRLLRKPGNKIVRVAGAAPLAGGVMVYAIDVDGRRIIFGTSPRALCVLDRYRLSDRSNDEIQRELALRVPKSDNT